MVEIIRMTEEHVAHVTLIERECFHDCAWSEGSLSDSLKSDGACFFVAICDGSVVGYAGMNCVLDEGYITNVAVIGDYRRRGVADKLLAALDECMDRAGLSFISLEVRVSNLAAIALYEKHGYKSLGVRKAFYRSPTEDAYIMTKERGI